VHPDDERLGLLLKALRRRGGIRQRDLARIARVPVRELMRVEAGRAGEVRLDRLRSLMDAAGGRGRFVPLLNGASAERLLDERHAALVERAARVFAARGWQTAIELTFSEFGERESIDPMGLSERSAIAAVCEVKTAFGSLEETNRMLDVKVRLAPKLCRDRFGWTPRYVARLLILPDESTIRRMVDRHAQTMSQLYPARSRQVRKWLRDPEAPLAGIWFLSEMQTLHRVTP
jgi:transcriptional regulator with XRE-family HTH domain